MNIFSAIPDYVATAIIAAIFATLGFFARKFYDQIEELWAKRKNTIKKLQQLNVLLDESKSIFDNQDYLVRRLNSLLKNEFGDETTDWKGYDETFFRMYPVMTDEQIELFSLIRGCTMNSMRRVNEELLHWIKDNSVIELSERKLLNSEKFNTQLAQLKKHLNLWFDKYEAVFKLNERRSLIYLADEKEHGIGFPRDLKTTLDSILAEVNRVKKDGSNKKDSKQQLLLNEAKKSVIASVSQIDTQSKLTKSEFETALDNAIKKIVNSADARNKELEGHTQRVTEMALRIATAMGISGDELKQIERGAILHDIGKSAVPEEILQKESKLSEEELAIMRQHPIYAYEILQSVSYLRPLAEIPYCHHENWDGTGYPREIKGDEIPLAARIFAIADVWEALSTDRPYRKGWSNEKVKEYIQSKSTMNFDPKIVEIFLGMK